MNIVQTRGYGSWVLGVLATEIMSHASISKCKIVDIPFSYREVRSWNGFLRLPHSEINLFLHHNLALKAIRKGWLSDSTQINIVYITHLTGPVSELADLKGHISFYLVNNSSTVESLNKLGIKKDKVTLLHNPIHEDFMFSHKVIPERDVVFVCNYYKRKRPDLILSTVQAMPDLTFSLIGKGWRKQPEFEPLLRCGNFTYNEFRFDGYIDQLKKHRVFCSLSDLEGGPVPLLESLVSGLNVVCTDTGSARDLIPSDRTSNILPINPKTDLISSTIRAALNQVATTFQQEHHYFYPGFTEYLEHLISDEISKRKNS